MNVYSLAAQFRNQLLRRDARAGAELLSAYNEAFKSMQEELTDIARQIEASKQDASPSLILQQRRMRELQQQVTAAIEDLGQQAAKIATRDQRAAALSAPTEAAQLVAAKTAQSAVAEVGGVFNRLPTDVIREFVGVSRDGSPVREVFDEIARELGLETGERIKREIIKGLTLGWNPERIARQVRRESDARGSNSKRNPAVVRRLHGAVRNETFRAYREATRATYQENDDVVQKWRWVSRKGPTTCIVCWSQDGKTFSLDTPFASHHNCRCVQTPVLIGEKEKYTTGPESFAQLEEGVQRDILGERAFNAWRNGEVESLEDFVETRSSAKWGPSRARRSLEDALSGKRTARSLEQYLGSTKTKLPKPELADALARKIAEVHKAKEGSTHNLYFGDLSGRKLFAVSVFPRQTTKVQGRLVSKQMLAEYLEANQRHLADPRVSVGTWYDPENNESIVDIILTEPGRQRALKLGSDYNQRGIFDLAAGEEIPTGGTGEAGAARIPAELPPMRRGRKG